MDKKELKKFINENGFFMQLDIVEKAEIDTFEGLDKNAIVVKTGKKVPSGENIVVFHGKASQKFGAGEQSRNEYKIDPKAWDVDNYKLNPQILLQHDSGNPIGKAIELLIAPKGLDVLYYIDLDTMDEKEAYKVNNGYFSALSTGHITMEYLFEHNDTGARITPEEFYSGDYLWKDYIKVVTLAELAEISVVALPSNPKALTVKNALSNFFNTLNMKVKKNEDEAENAESKTAEKAEETKDETTENVEETKETEESTDAKEGDESTEESTEEGTEKKSETTEESTENSEEEKPEEAEKAEPEEKTENKVEVKLIEPELAEKLIDALVKVAEGVDALSARVSDIESNQKAQPTKQPIATLNKVREAQAKNSPIAKALREGFWRG